MAQTVKRLPTRRKTWVHSLGQEDPLEKEMATHSSTHAWKIPWMEKPGGLQSTGLQRVGSTERLHFHFLSFIQKVIFASTQMPVIILTVIPDRNFINVEVKVLHT